MQLSRSQFLSLCCSILDLRPHCLGWRLLYSLSLSLQQSLKTRVEYIWNRATDNRILSGCKVGTWSRYF